MPTVRIEPAGVDLEVKAGESVAEAAWRQDLTWPTKCWGQLDCMSCFTKIVDGELDAIPADSAELDAIRFKMAGPMRTNPLIRLGCHLRVSGDGLVLHKQGFRPATAEDSNMLQDPTTRERDMTVTERAESGADQLGKDQLAKLWETMCRCEALDTRILNGIKRGELPTVIWPSRGQEAVPAALGLALREDDRLVTTYRGLHDHVAKGVPLTEIIGEVMGTSVGASKGKGGTMHITDPAHGVMMTTGIVGSGVPVAVGLALAAKKDGSDRVTVVTFGDGATNTGSFHEGVNLAATWKLPVVFLCQNNLYAEMTPVEETMAIEHVADRAKGVGMPGVTVDGNDPVATFQAISEAVRRARAGEGPTLIEAVTFRFEGHYAGDTSHYIPDEQMQQARANDPMVTFPVTLAASGFSETEIEGARTAAKEEIEQALVATLAAPAPDLDQIELDVYADGMVVSHV